MREDAGVGQRELHVADQKVRIDTVERQDERLGVVELVKFAVIVVVGEVNGDDFVHLVIFEQGAQRRVVEIAALDVILAIDGDRLEIRDGGDAGKEGIHECVETGIVDAAQNLVDVEETALSLAQVGGTNIPPQGLQVLGEQLAPPWIIEQERLAAAVLVNGEEMRAGGEQRRAQTEKVGEDMKDVGDVEPERLAQDRR